MLFANETSTLATMSDFMDWSSMSNLLMSSESVYIAPGTTYHTESVSAHMKDETPVACRCHEIELSTV